MTEPKKQTTIPRCPKCTLRFSAVAPPVPGSDVCGICEVQQLHAEEFEELRKRSVILRDAVRDGVQFHRKQYAQYVKAAKAERHQTRRAELNKLLAELGEDGFQELARMNDGLPLSMVGPKGFDRSQLQGFAALVKKVKKKKK